MSPHVRPCRIGTVLRNENGTALVELGLLLPLFILVYIGVLYYADLITAQGRVGNAADAIARTAASFETCLRDDDATRNNIFNAASALLPERDFVSEMVLTSLRPETDADGEMSGAWVVQWSAARTGAAASPGSGYSSFTTEQDKAFADARAWGKPLMVAQVTTSHAPSIPVLEDMVAREITRESIIPASSAAATCAEE